MKTSVGWYHTSIRLEAISGEPLGLDLSSTLDDIVDAVAVGTLWDVIAVRSVDQSRLTDEEMEKKLAELELRAPSGRSGDAIGRSQSTLQLMVRFGAHHCGHSACSQHFIDTGSLACIAEAETAQRVAVLEEKKDE